MDNESFVVRS